MLNENSSLAFDFLKWDEYRYHGQKGALNNIKIISDYTCRSS